MSKHRFKWFLAAAAFSVIAMLPGKSMAVPSLQLDILNGTYDSGTETIVATSNPFTLYAYLVPDAKAPLNDTYYISTAVVPAVGPAAANLGSFIFNGNTVNVTADMTYGTPDGLQTHGIFPTYYSEFSFQFDSNNTSQQYDTSTDTGQGPIPFVSGDPMYYQAFNVDVGNLNSDYRIHFDLYNKDEEGQAYQFAPFSHDAESGPTGNNHKVPEPSTFGLLGSGLTMLYLSRKKEN